MAMVVACAAMPLVAATQKVGAYTWTYEITDGTAAIKGTYDGGKYTPCVSPEPTGAVAIPATLGGKPVTSIKGWAFNECSGMTSVLVPESVTSITSYAFYGCSGLTSLMLPDSVKSISGYAFVDCTGLKNATIPGSVTTIGNYAFKGCTSLEHMVLPHSFKTAANIDTILQGCSLNPDDVRYYNVNVKVVEGIAWAYMVRGGG